MTDRDDQDHRPEPQPLAHGRRTRVVAVLIGLALSLGVPVVLVGGGPMPTVDGHAVGRLADPAGLGITGALPGDPLPVDSVQGDGISGSGALTTVAPTDAMPGDLVGGGQQPSIPTPPNLPDGPLGIPGAVLDAYQFAQRTLAANRPGCQLSWAVLAGIGRIESNHASDGRVDAFGNTLGSILGPRLDGSPGMAAIPDTDRGQLDGDTVWDRAVGPMQFIPSSWRSWGVDGNGDGVANPNNIYDSTVATGLYLCAGGTDLTDQTQLQAAVFRYNHSAAYVDIVLGWARAYQTGVVPVPSAPGPVPPGTNGNGGRSISADAVSLAVSAPVAQPAPLAVRPPTTASAPQPSPSPAITTTPATATTLPTTLDPPLAGPSAVTPSSTTPPPALEPSPRPSSSVVTTTTSPATESPWPPLPPLVITTTPPATTTSSLPSSPPPTTP